MGEIVMLKVRRATSSDHLDVFKLAALMHAETDFKHYHFDPMKTLQSIGTWDNGSDRALFIVDNEGDIVGMLACCVEDMAFSHDIVAAENVFFVRPDMRGSRAAYLLLRAFYIWSNEIGAQHIRAGVATRTGESAHRLYEHFGLDYVGSNFTAHLDRS